ncbi:hypothetical protein BX616_002711 [Lobosporangium transversale]|nr:hypothetical protein BX616_002711 [Lobosporangium transversale]
MENTQTSFQGPIADYIGPAFPPGHPMSSNTSGFKTQLAISISLGLAFFGWIPRLLDIKEEVLLERVGLDAALMLRFFVMCMRLFAACLIPGLLVILPINIYTNSDGDLNLGPDIGHGYDPSLSSAALRQGTSLLYLSTQFTFTWIFSLMTLYAIWHTYEGYIDVRRKFLLKRKKSIVNRSIMVIGLPAHLQSDRALATFYESLGVGTVESAHVGRHVTSLKRQIEQRAYALRALEIAYTEYYGNPSSRLDYDPDIIAAENDHTIEHTHHQSESNLRSTSGDEFYHQVADDHSSSSSESETDEQQMSHGNRNKKMRRPTLRLGFLGLFGKKVDKIKYRQEVFAALDKAVQKKRMSRVWATTSTGFVTFEEMNAAQILAQTVNTQETLTCETFLAPEPRDVYWDNLNLPPNELDVRTVVINVIVFILIFFWSGPVSVFSSFLNLASLNKIFPGISKLAGKNAILKSLIQGFLPTVGVIIFLAVVPQFLLILCRRQGIRSHSEIAHALYSKYFTFILFNVVLVFTIVGTWAQAFNKVYHNLGELTLLLAASLPRVSPFFVNYIILRGIGLFPLQLLQAAHVFVLLLQKFISRTPRDYAEARAPPELPYGVVYANATLVFVVVLIYSCIRPAILIFGTIYFAVGYLVFKYQLLYVYFHPYESGGKIWPMVYNRLTLGLLTFQLTMLGLFMLKHAYFFGVLLAPLPAGTAWFWYRTTNIYKWTATYMPLELLRPSKHDGDILDDHSYPLHGPNSVPSTFQSGNINKNNSLTTLRTDVASVEGNRPEHQHSVALDMEVASNGGASENIKAAKRRSNIGGLVTTPEGPRRSMPARSVVDDDDYQATPDRHTDFRQPPMSLYPGVLNSSMRHYSHPALRGPLPTLWLPLKKNEYLEGHGKNRISVFVNNEELNQESGNQQEQEQREQHSRELSLSLPNKDSADPYRRDFDEGDNMAGGGQDEDDDGEEEGYEGDLRGNQGYEEVEHLESIETVGYPMPGPSSLSFQQGQGMSPPNSAGSNNSSSAAYKRNLAVEGIDDVYYHHPERRLSNASLTSRIRSMAATNIGGRGEGGSGHRYRLPSLRSQSQLARLRGPRANLFRDQNQDSPYPPNTDDSPAPASGWRSWLLNRKKGKK